MILYGIYQKHVDQEPDILGWIPDRRQKARSQDVLGGMEWAVGYFKDILPGVEVQVMVKEVK